MVNIYKVELLIEDFDEIGAEEIKDVIENQKFPNRCISPSVMRIDVREIDWSDDHPINLTDQREAEYRRLFDHPAAEDKNDG